MFRKVFILLLFLIGKGYFMPAAPITESLSNRYKALARVGKPLLGCIMEQSNFLLVVFSTKEMSSNTDVGRQFERNSLREDSSNYGQCAK